MPRKDGSLTNKEKAFCEEYIANGYNATQAYLTAYNCAYSTAHAQGWRMLRKPELKQYITDLQKQAFEAACINAERVALKLADIAFADKHDDVYNASSQLKVLDLLQKQLGLQHQKIEADISTEINITIEDQESGKDG